MRSHQSQDRRAHGKAESQNSNSSALNNHGGDEELPVWIGF
jgi:hypothetical protein